ncbi:MAG: DNA mismatch repair endonuclease MutL [Clostridia bacterium]|nr:DNA mismatch repair endonuclease MutL [Clostridia bacterium]
MGKIYVLEKSVAEKIAAGEVVQRPSSVVKELAENAVDAKARSIVVEIKQGGVSYIRVSDNGTGIASDDAETAFLRHATSKIRSAEDLNAIVTMGFRGEALCSISAVSRSEIITKTLSEDAGSHIVCEGGEIISRAEAGCPEGTTVIVRNLFYNTPARKKFLKRDATEAAYVGEVCERIALSHPDISVRYIRDGKDIFFTPGDGKLENAIYAVFGKDTARAMLNVSYEASGVLVEGMIGDNTLSRPNRSMQYFFVNGRSVVNKTLSAALAEGYKNNLMTGRFPVAVLNVKLPPGEVDVNVHPSKTEVKFSDDEKIYTTLYWAVKNRLAQSADAPLTGSVKQKPFVLAQKQIESVQGRINAAGNKVTFAPYVPSAPETARRKYSSVNSVSEGDVREKEPLPQEEIVPQIKVIGQLFATYILAQVEDEFVIADQHAAHERLKYEEIKSKGGRCAPQLLIAPISVTLTREEADALVRNAEFFTEAGFEYEAFGENTVALRAVPSGVEAEEAKDLLVSLCTQILRLPKGEYEEARDKLIYTVACKAALKANRFMTVREMEILLSDALAMEGISTCPHGRPIFMRFTKEQIEKMFKRIV